MRQLFRELKRRHVFRVAAVYAVVAWVVIQVANTVLPRLQLPSWTVTFVIVLVALGFPIVLVMAWAFEMTAEGVRRTPEAEGAEAAEASADNRGSQSRLAMKALVGLGLVGAAVAGGWYLMGGGGTTVSDRSVAVLPFETLGDTASTPFTEGLHNDLLTRLQRVSDLTVIARPSVIRYQDTDKPLSQVAEELNARWIVTAAVQQAGDRVQVNPRLVDPRTGTERWSESYRGEFSADEVFALQQEITRSIADALETELASGERERVGGLPTEDLAAYRLYVQGRRQFGRRAGRDEPDENVEEAVRYFRRAIEQDSTFALAWAGLADAAALYSASVPDSITAPEVTQAFAAQRAVTLDPDLAEAHASMGHLHLRNQNAPAALRELKRALELKPSYWEAHAWLGELYLKLGHRQRALDHLKLAVELNPQHSIARWRLYDAYLATGQPERSLSEARRAENVGGEIRALYHLGRFDQVRRLAHERVEKGFDVYRVLLALTQAADGDTAEAREQLDRFRSEHPDWHLYIGVMRAALGETEQALAAWNELKPEDWGAIPAPHVLRNGVLVELAPLRDDPRYQELIRKANRAWGLNPDGSIPDSVDVTFKAPADE